jgi:hypothetical protein
MEREVAAHRAEFPTFMKVLEADRSRTLRQLEFTKAVIHF